MEKILRFLKVALLAASLLVLASCGGGGGGSPSTPSASNAAPTNVILMEVSSQEVGTLSASWLPASDDSTPAASIKYQLHISTDAGFTPSADTFKFEGTGVNSTIVNHLTAGATYYVRLVAMDQQGASTTSNALKVSINDTVAILQLGVSTTQLQPADVAQVNTGSVVLNAGVAPPTVGQYIASADGDGYLRKVTGVNGSTLQTQSAPINDVASDFKFSSTFKLPSVSQGVANAAMQSGLAVITTTQNNGPAMYAWPQTSLRYSVATQPPPLSLQAGVATTADLPNGEKIKKVFTGSAGFSVSNDITTSFDPELATEVVISWGKLKHAKVQVSASPKVIQTLAVHATAQGEIDQKLLIVSPRKFTKTYWLPNGLPVVISGEFWMDMRIKGNVTGALDSTEQLTIGYDDISYGIEYANGSYSKIMNVQPVYNLKIGGNGKAEANLQIALLPSMKIMAYESLTSMAILEPYTTVTAGVEGLVQLDAVVDPNNTTWQSDADYRLTKSSLAGGARAWLYADFHIYDWVLASYPRNANTNDYTTYEKIDLIVETPFLGLPALSATVDYNAVHPSNKSAIRIVRQATNVSNPLKSLFGNLPAAFVTWQNWSATRIIPPIGVTSDSYQVLSSPTGNDGEIWVVFTKPGTYTVRVGGYTNWGTWARQYADVSVKARADVVAPTPCTLPQILTNGVCVTPTNGACGSSNGVARSSVPTGSFCSTGTASTVTGSGPWNWSCSGSNGGTNASCSAAKLTTAATNGTCGSSNGATVSSAPSSNLCSAGTTGTVTGSGPWSWSCSGSNGGTNASCSATKQTATTNGTCGSSNGVAVSSAPTVNLCSAGTTGTVSGSGPWNWSCSGSNGGTNASCSAAKLTTAATNGTCGSSNGATVSSAPSSNLCSAGTTGTVSGSGPWNWSCSGSNGGTNASCSATPAAPSTPTGAATSGVIGTSSGPGPVTPSSTVNMSWNTSSGTGVDYNLIVTDITNNTQALNIRLPGNTYTRALTAGHQYRWQVAACNATCSPYTAAQYFQTPGTVAATPTVSYVTPSTITQGTGNQSVTITGSGFTSSSYHQYSVSGGSSWAWATVAPAAINNSTSMTITVANTTLQTMSYRVCGTYGNTATCSTNKVDVTVQAAAASIPATPTGATPGSLSGPGTITPSSTVNMSWNTASGAVNYNLIVTDVTSNTQALNYTLPGNTYTTPLTAGHQYRWQVAACNTTGCSPYTAAQYFQTPGTTPSTPTGTATSGVIGTSSGPGPVTPSSTVNMSWNTSSGTGVDYNLIVTDVTSNTQALNIRLPGNTYTTALTAGHQYRWQVAACNATGCSPYTAAQYFQTPGALVVNGVASSYSGTGQKTISLTGSGFTSITQISWSCTDPNGSTCTGSPYVWTPGTTRWNNVAITSNTVANVYPTFLVATDSPGMYNWSVTFSGGGQSVTKYFTVTK